MMIRKPPRIDRLAELQGWRRTGWLFGLGALSVLALPPANFWPVLWLVVPLLIWTLDPGRSYRRQAWDGWCFAFGQFLFGLYWVAFALPVASDDLIWVAPFAAVGLPAGLALFGALAIAVCGRLRDPLARGLGFVVAWSVTEWLRGHILTGFPWNLSGYAWAGSDWLAQGAAWIGVYGLGVAVLLSAALPAGWPVLERRGRFVMLGLALALPTGFAVVGGLRLSAAPALHDPGAEWVGLRLVQPSITQREKWDPSFRIRNFSEHVRLSTEDRPGWVQAVIWPETAASFYLDETPQALQVLGQIAPDSGYVITGAPRRERDPLRLFNSLLAINTLGNIQARYDKAHLVPFGEYVPLRDILPFGQLVAGAIGYSPGPGPLTLALPGLPGFGALICYEVIFPGAVIGPGERPRWLVNLTNDAWYGHTAGPHQHWVQTRMRAIEEGVPIIRAASTGISGAADAYGRVLAELPLGMVGYVDIQLPLRDGPSTLYARLHDGAFFALLIIVLMGVWLRWRCTHD